MKKEIVITEADLVFCDKINGHKLKRLVYLEPGDHLIWHLQNNKYDFVAKNMMSIRAVNFIFEQLADGHLTLVSVSEIPRLKPMSIELCY